MVIRQDGPYQGLTLGLDLREQRGRLLLPQGSAAFDIEVGGDMLDLIPLLNERDDQRGGAVDQEGLDEAPARVGPAPNLDDPPR